MRGALTNFYPLYGDANDQVDRVTAVNRTLFQRVIPRYELSTSDTRDSGLGPEFIEQGTGTYGRLENLAERRAGASARAGANSGVVAGRAPEAAAAASQGSRPGDAGQAGQTGQAGQAEDAGQAGHTGDAGLIQHPGRALPRGWLPEGAGRYVDIYA
jgi:hypothetical protein